MSAVAPLYLASASPRRNELLSRLGVPFALVNAPVNEEALEAEFAHPVAHLAEHLARAKATAALEVIRARSTGALRVLAGDTTVLLKGHTLGKPRDAAHARSLLLELRARDHDVVTALAVASHGAADAVPVTMRSLAVRTRVTMRDYTEAEIAAYLATGDPFDKAGAYAIQHEEFHPVRAISGCYPNVVGLPVCAAAALLGVRAPDASDQPGACPWFAHCRAPLPEIAT
jgi:nucleoside triphosphate pyrophosphatase